MTRFIILFLATALLFRAGFVFAQESVLKLAEGKKYEMYFTAVAKSEWPLPADTIPGKFTICLDRDQSFLIDDSATIQKLKNGWVGEQSEMVGCWYDYFMYLVEDGVVVDEIRINEECKQAVTKDGVFNYTDSTLTQLDRSKKITVADITFQSLEFGRHFVRDVQGTRDIYMPGITEKHWYKYGGRMIVKTNQGDHDELQAKIASVIKDEFPGEQFEVWFFTCNDSACFFDVYCSDVVGTGLKKFEIYREWSRFAPWVRLISKTDARVKELVDKYVR